jgi:hypothetical protein
MLDTEGFRVQGESEGDCGSAGEAKRKSVPKQSFGTRGTGSLTVA